MAAIKTVLCLGNQTADTDARAHVWAERLALPNVGLINSVDQLATGVQHADLGVLDIDDVYSMSLDVDLVILLDQPVGSFDSIETYYHLINLTRYLKHFRPVLYENSDTINQWISCGTNQQTFATAMHTVKNNTNVALRLWPVDDLNGFRTGLQTMADNFKSKNCRWVMYRASEHESMHQTVTELLLNHREFVLLTPGVFTSNLDANIKAVCYHHWLRLYL